MQNDYINTTVPIVPRRPLHSYGGGKKKTVFLLLTVFIVALAIASFILFRMSTWDGRSAISFLVVFSEDNQESLQRSLAIVTLQPEDHSLDVIEIPDTLKIDTIYGYGQYSSSALYGLMKLEKHDMSFLTQTMTFQFGIPVEHVVMLPEKKQNVDIDLLANSFWNQMLFKEVSTFSYLDRVKAWWYLTHVRKDKMTSIDMLSSGLIHGDVLDIIKSDQIISQVFPDPKIREEQISVAIVNTTNEAKLGTRLGRIFFNMGINVVRVTDSKDSYEKTKLVYSYNDHKNFLATKIIQNIFVIPKDNVFKEAPITEEYRADLVLLIGEDIAKMFQTMP